MQLAESHVDIEDVAIALERDLGDKALDAASMAKEYLDTVNKTYTREMFLPAGTIAIGQMHKRACVNIITKGSIIVKATVEDEGVAITVPHEQSVIFSSAEFSRKLVYAVTDTVVINVFSNVEAQTLEEVEAELVVPSKKYNTRNVRS